VKHALNALKNVLLSALVALATVNTASAVSVSFEVSDFFISTTTTSGIDLTSSPGAAPALPADATFTIPADAVFNLPPNASNTYLPAEQGKFLRFSFDLPGGFYDLSFDFKAIVNDEFVLYVNATPVAIQSSTGTDNFVDPLPGFPLSATGTATDASKKLEYLLTSGMQSLFLAGTNELTLFGTDTLLDGGINGISVTITAVPEAEAYAMMLAGLGLLVPVALRRRSHSRS
jgi:hypothetical protein